MHIHIYGVFHDASISLYIERERGGQQIEITRVQEFLEAANVSPHMSQHCRELAWVLLKTFELPLTAAASCLV